MANLDDDTELSADYNPLFLTIFSCAEVGVELKIKCLSSRIAYQVLGLTQNIGR